VQPISRACSRFMRNALTMSREEVDAYLANLEDPKRSTLVEMRKRILAVVPDAEECISYGMPAFRLRGKVVAGFAAFKHHLSYLPHSGRVFPELEAELVGYEKSTGALRFSIDEPLPEPLVRRLVEVRVRQLGGS
jgi:uncharacterized protein YdhG (YjbR/CyaY superfamily)